MREDVDPFIWRDYLPAEDTNTSSLLKYFTHGPALVVICRIPG